MQEEDRHMQEKEVLDLQMGKHARGQISHCKKKKKKKKASLSASKSITYKKYKDAVSECFANNQRQQGITLSAMLPRT